MTDISTVYSKISEEIKYYHNLILEEAKKNLKIKELYKGCQILFSPLIHQPDFLLIGFNPGGGYYKWHGKIVEEFQPMQALEYYENKHSLGEQTKNLFSLAGKDKDLEDSTVKINFYPWATDNVADFNELMRLLPKPLSADLFHYSRVWTKRIIQVLEPKTIVCEGFTAIDEVAAIFPEKSDFIKNENLRSFHVSGGIKVLAYKRNQGNIISKHKIIEGF